MMNRKTTTASPVVRGENAPPRNGPRRPGAWRKLIPYAIGGGLLLLVVMGLRPKPVPVELATVSRGPLTVSVLEEGKTRIRHRYMISPPMGGFLNRVDLRAGARIEAGKTVLASIKPQSSTLLDPRAQAESEARVNALEAARSQRETQIERAREALDLAKKERDRALELKKTGAISAREWDAADSQVNVLTREFNAAQFALQVSEFELKQARAALMQVQSPASSDAEPFEILSPVDGFVLNIFEESARVMPAGTPIMEVGDTNDLEAEIELLSSDAVAVQPGAEVSIEQWGGGKPLRGRVSMVEPGGYTKISSLGVEEQRVKVRVDFIDPLPAGTFLGDRYRVEARIVTWHAENVLQVPTGALFRRGGDWMTFLYEGGKARLTKVEIEHNSGVAAEIRSGLSEGQRVIVHPPDAVADDAKVSPR
jgi:HlyD family secretion protein